MQGQSTYSGYNLDQNYITNLFDPSAIDGNYRSIFIDDWADLYDSLTFEKVKVSLYKSGIESKYFVLDASNDSISWFSEYNLIDSSYSDSLSSNYATFGIDATGMHVYINSVYFMVSL